VVLSSSVISFQGANSARCDIPQRSLPTQQSQRITGGVSDLKNPRQRGFPALLPEV